MLELARDIGLLIAALLGVVVAACVAWMDAPQKGRKGRRLRGLAVIAALSSSIAATLGWWDKRQENIRLKQDVTTQTSRHTDLQTRLETVQKSYEQVKNQLAEARKQMAELQSTTTDTQARTKSLQAQQLEPLIAVTAESPIDPQKPLMVPFVIRNVGNVALRNFDFRCGLESVKFANGPTISQSFISFEMKPVPVVKPQESATAFCDLGIPLRSFVFQGDGPGTVVDADISLLVSFETDSGRQERGFRFVTAPPGKALRWIAQPWAQ